jgi:hypothetical protein
MRWCAEAWSYALKDAVTLRRIIAARAPPQLPRPIGHSNRVRKHAQCQSRAAPIRMLASSSIYMRTPISKHITPICKHSTPHIYNQRHNHTHTYTHTHTHTQTRTCLPKACDNSKADRGSCGNCVAGRILICTRIVPSSLPRSAASTAACLCQC